MTARAAASGGPAGRNRPRLEAASPRHGEKIIHGLLAGCGVVSVLVTTAIVISLLFPTINFFEHVSLTDFLTGTEWTPAFANGEFGVLPIVVGTLNVVFWALLVAIPVGLASAIYLAEYASNRVRKIVKPALEMLEGIPTVAIGLFALLFLRPLAETVFPFLPWTGPFSIGVAGVAVGLLTVPLVASISDDAMRSVPAGLREGAFALGASKLGVSTRVVFPAAVSGIVASVVLATAREVASKLGVSTRVVFPAAVSGIVASVVLATSRAVGETMVVLMAAGASPNLTFDPTRSATPMTAYIGQTATGDIATGTIQYDTIFAVGALLFTLTLIMNMFAIRLVRRFREVYE